MIINSDNKCWGIKTKFHSPFAIIRSDDIRNYWRNCQDIEVIQKFTMFDVWVHKIQIRGFEHRLSENDPNASISNVTFQCQMRPNKFQKMTERNLYQIEREEWNEPFDASTQKKTHHLAQIRLCNVVVNVQLFVELLFVAHTVQPFGYLYNGFRTRKRRQPNTINGNQIPNKRKK